MSPDFVKDAERERAEWLEGMGASEDMVHVERDGKGLEFIFVEQTDEEGMEHLTKVILLYTIQKLTTLDH